MNSAKTQSSTSFRQWLGQMLRDQPAKPALLSASDPPLATDELDALLTRLVKDLETTGVAPQDRLAVLMSAGPDMAVTCLALMSTAICLPFNPDSPALELEQRLTAVGANWLLCDASLLEVAESVAESIGIGLIQVERLNSAWDSMVLRCKEDCGLASSRRGDTENPGPDDPVLCLQTSGSTAQPKVVPLSLRNLQASVISLCDSLKLTPEDRSLNMLPMYHVGGLIDLLLAPLHSGGSTFVTTDMSVSSFRHAYHNGGVTWFQAVPTMLQNIVNDIAPEELSASRLRFIRTVSSPLPNRLLHQVESIFQAPVVEMYGMTETAGIICSNPLPPEPRKPGSVGRSFGLQLRVVNRKSKPLAANQVGEVQVRGGNVFSGYETRPAEKFNEFDGDWFRTGDEGYLDDDGYLYLVGRIKEIINKGGEKIAPLELDRAAELFPEVRQAAAFAMPHLTLGEDVAMALMVEDKQNFDEQAFINHLRRHLASFKLPKQITYLDRLPRTRAGKLQRHRVLSLVDEQRVRQPIEKTLPSTELEKQLAAIWCERLKLEQVYREDNFFEAGGDSLNAAVLMMEIQSRLDVEIPMSSLFQAPTIGELAALILGSASTPVVLQQDILQQVANELGAFMSGWLGERLKSDGLLVGRNTSGNRQPLFWGVNAYPEYDHFARALDPNQPVYGFRSLYKTNFRYQVSPAQLAKLYVEEIRSIQPRGPYLIGGFCEAGKVAFELAELLQSEGEQVASLMLQDQFVAKPYDGRVACFICAVGGNSPYYRFHRPISGWRKYYSASLVLYRSRIKHKHIYRQPQVGLFAQQIAHEIRIAQNGEVLPGDMRNRLQVLPLAAYRVCLSSSNIPERALPLSRIPLQVTVTNSSRITWLQTERSGILLAARWRNKRDVVKHWCAGVSSLEKPLQPGETVTVNISVRVPLRPGKYDLELDMVDDGVAWFNDRQDPPIRQSVRVSLAALGFSQLHEAGA